jgi:drug/metabolite transporter (DMT)-like permease
VGPAGAHPVAGRRSLDHHTSFVTRKPHALVPLALTAAVVGVSFSGPLVRLSHAEPLAIAVWRMGITLAIVATALCLTGTWRQYRGLAPADLLAGAGAGVFLAVHLWSWTVSIGMTSVAASVVLVNTHPIVVALGSAAWLGERPTRIQLAGIAVALGGAALLAFGDAGGGGIMSHGDLVAGDMLTHGGGRRALEGDALAVLGAVTVALYLLVGRRLRQRLDVWPYVTLVYGVCFAILLVVALARGATLATLVAQPPRELALFAAMAIGPTILGHTAYNWVLRHVRAYVVSVTVLGEPLGATLLAALIPSIAEVPGVLTLAGGGIIMAGILLTARRD